jgi:hypothetical protein
MAGSAPNFDNVRMGGPDGIRIPQELGSVTFVCDKLVAIDVGGAGTTNTVNLTPDQCLGTEFIVTNAGSGATTVTWPAAFPGHVFVASNASGQSCTFVVSGQTGIAVANAKKAILVCESTDIARVTADT